MAKTETKKKQQLTNLADTRPIDLEATAEDCKNDLRRVQKEFPNKFITNNFYRTEGTYSDKTWKPFFGTFLEFKRQAGLQSTRGQHKFERDLGKHVSIDTYRNFYEEEVLPWVGQYEKDHEQGEKTIMVCSDLHDTELDPFFWSVFLDSAERIQPDIIVLNGDIYDMYEWSRFDKDPRRFSMKERFDFVRNEILAPLRQICPDSQIDFILGNHEFRILKHLADKTPEMRVWLSDVMGLTFADLLGLPELEINLVSKWDLAQWKVKDITAEVRKNYKVYFDCFVCNHAGDEGFGLSGTSGHIHRPKMSTDGNALGNTWWVTTGCGCVVNTDYMQRLEKAQQSFLIVHLNSYTREVIPEHILFGKTTAIVGGILYRRQSQ